MMRSDGQLTPAYNIFSMVMYLPSGEHSVIERLPLLGRSTVTFADFFATVTRKYKHWSGPRVMYCEKNDYLNDKSRVDMEHS